MHADPRALLITGTVGVGKTSVAEAVGEALAARAIPTAVIDLDWLRRFWPTTADDPFNQALTLRNLRAVAANFRAAGAHRLVLAGVIESVAERDAHREALGAPLTVCRLTADRATVIDRLTRRHEHAGGLRWYVDRAAELDDVLDRAALAGVTVDATHLSIAEAAARALTAVGW